MPDAANALRASTLRVEINELLTEISEQNNAIDRAHARLAILERERSRRLAELYAIESPEPVESLATRRVEARRWQRRCQICNHLTIEANRHGKPECAKHTARMDRDVADVLTQLFADINGVSDSNGDDA